VTTAADLALLPDVRDADLIARIEGARGSFTYDFTLRSCRNEQAQRDALALLPRDARRRQELRNRLDLGAIDRQNLRHIHSVLAICGLPYTRQGIEVREFERTQGRMSLIVEAGKLQTPDGRWENQPLPYGSRARLLLLHLCSEAIRQKSAVVDIEDSLTAFIKAMGFPVTGGKYGTLTSFKAQVNALAACHMRIGVWDGTRAKTVSTQPFSSIDVWFPTSAEQKMLWPSTITFSHEFFTTLTSHALPVNIDAVRVFAGSPRKLDLLFWLGYRLNTLSEPLHISWEALAEQWGQGYNRQRNFRRDFAQEIGHIRDIFPKLPVKLTDEGCIIHPAGPDVLAIPHRRPSRRA
jgi:Plasmid encoded RepA protein